MYVMKFGLPNIGYTCYLNTGLQCLFNCEYFIHYLEKSKKDFTMLKSFYESFSDTQLSEKEKLNIYKSFLNCIRKNIPSLEINIENDIHEFFVLFMDLYFEYFKRVVKIQKPSSRTIVDIVKYNSDAHWYNEFSDICDLLFSQHVIKTQCNSCGHKVYNYETTSVISIDISNSIDSIQQGMDKHFDSTKISDWKCDKCKLSNNVTRTTHIIRAPKILVVCMQRFSYDKNKVVKNEKQIQIDKCINLSKYFYVEQKQSQYSLKSIALHHGDAYNGHYTSVLYDCDKSVLIDDMNIVDLQKFESPLNIKSLAYLLFYEITS